MTENEISGIILDRCIHIHRILGPGLLESVYESVLSHDLARKGLTCERQIPIPVSYEGMNLELGFRADLIVEQKILVELKSVETIHPVHKKQVLTYLRLTGLKLGLLINFNVNLVKTGLIRIVNRL